MQALQITRFGEPTEVLELTDIDDPPPPGPGEVVVAMEYAPIHPSDLLMIRGGSGPRPSMPASMGSFPATMGTEGVGRIIAAGEGVTTVGPGDRVLTPFNVPSWAEQVVIPAIGLFRLPDGFDGAQLSMLTINPLTALVMLSEFVTLERGDWVIQNVANSAVGRAVVAVARDRGLRTVNVVRRPGLEDELMEIGADVVVIDGPGLEEKVRDLTSGADIRLGFDAVGGDSTLTLSSCLSAGGSLVVYGSMGKNPCRIAARQLIVGDVAVRGFWLVRWIDNVPPERTISMQRELLRLVGSGALHMPVTAIVPISKPAEAMARAVEGSGKVLFAIGASS